MFFSARHHKKIFSAETFFRANIAYVTSSGWIPAAFSFKFAILWTCWDVTHYPSRLQHQTNANTNLGTLENSKSKFDLIYQQINLLQNVKLDNNFCITIALHNYFWIRVERTYFSFFKKIKINWNYCSCQSTYLKTKLSMIIFECISCLSLAFTKSVKNSENWPN